MLEPGAAAGNVSGSISGRGEGGRCARVISQLLASKRKCINDFADDETKIALNKINLLIYRIGNVCLNKILFAFKARRGEEVWVYVCVWFQFAVSYRYDEQYYRSGVRETEI